MFEGTGISFGTFPVGKVTTRDIFAIVCGTRTAYTSSGSPQSTLEISTISVHLFYLKDSVTDGK